MRRALTLAAGTCLTALAVPLSAQTQVDPEATASATRPAADTGEIVVTAQRRSESLSKVPIAITVVSGAQLTNTGATRLSDIQQFAPSVQYTDTPAQPSYQIRGIGTESYDNSVEQAVGIALDGANITLRTNPLALLADVERIEVLRGPQGLLFGKNTTAGLISIITRKPLIGTYSNEGHVQFGSRDQVQVYDIVNVPLGDTLAARVKAGYQTGNSPIRNLGTGQIADRRDYDFNGKLLWTPTDRLNVYAIGDYQRTHGDSGTATIRSYDPAPGATFAPGKVYGATLGAPRAGGPDFIRQQLSALGIVAGPNNRTTAIDTDNFATNSYYGGQLSINYELGGGQTITSDTAYHRVHDANNLEVDQTPLRVLDDNGATLRSYELTQELRIASPNGQKLEYVGGLYYYRQRTHSTQVQAGTLGLVPNDSQIILQPNLIGGQQNALVDSKSYAAFGQATYHLSDGFRLLAGARFTHDDLKARQNVTAVANICGVAYGLLPIPSFCQVNGSLQNLMPGATLPTPTIGGRTKHNDWSGRAGVEYDVLPHSMVYATVSRGYKGAAVSTVSNQVFDVKPETVVAYELGLKSQFFDRRLSLSLALFREDFRDFQAEVFDPSLGIGAFRTGNAGKLRTQGVEAEFTARPVRGFSLSGGVTYDHAKYRRYTPPCYAGQTAAEGCDYATNPLNPTFDAAGDRLTNAPAWSASLTGGYETRITDGSKGFASVNWSYRSRVIYQVGDLGTRQGGYGLTNVNLGIGDRDDRVRLSVFVRNLFDKRYASKIYSTLFDIGGYSQVVPDNAFRRIGVALDWRF